MRLFCHTGSDALMEMSESMEMSERERSFVHDTLVQYHNSTEVESMRLSYSFLVSYEELL